MGLSRVTDLGRCVPDLLQVIRCTYSRCQICSFLRFSLSVLLVLSLMSFIYLSHVHICRSLPFRVILWGFSHLAIKN
nr:MAG TPA: hypothetical protein [Caudoviricetes sp.]